MGHSGSRGGRQQTGGGFLGSDQESKSLKWRPGHRIRWPGTGHERGDFGLRVVGGGVVVLRAASVSSAPLFSSVFSWVQGQVGGLEMFAQVGAR